MEIISKAYEWLINALKTLSCIIVFAIFVLIVMDVLMPFVGLQPWEGTLGVVEYGLLWFTILAAPWLARIKGHVFIDAVAEMLSTKARKITSDTNNTPTHNKEHAYKKKEERSKNWLSSLNYLKHILIILVK